MFAFRVSAYDETHLLKAKVTGDCPDCDLSGADLEGVEGLDIEQLSKVKTLFEAKLDPELMKQVKEKYPHLLEKPKEEKTEEEE